MTIDGNQYFVMRNAGTGTLELEGKTTDGMEFSIYGDLGKAHIPSLTTDQQFYGVVQHMR